MKFYNFFYLVFVFFETCYLDCKKYEVGNVYVCEGGVEEFGLHNAETNEEDCLSKENKYNGLGCKDFIIGCSTCVLNEQSPDKYEIQCTNCNFNFMLIEQDEYFHCTPQCSHGGRLLQNDQLTQQCQGIKSCSYNLM